METTRREAFTAIAAVVGAVVGATGGVAAVGAVRAPEVGLTTQLGERWLAGFYEHKRLNREVIANYAKAEKQLLAVAEKALADLRSLRDIQCRDGTWNYNPDAGQRRDH